MVLYKGLKQIAKYYLSESLYIMLNRSDLDLGTRISIKNPLDVRTKHLIYDNF